MINCFRYKNCSTMEKSKYSIVEFENYNVALIPTTWLTRDDKRCVWPILKSVMQLNCLIASCEKPREDDNIEWIKLRVARVVCTTSKTTILHFDVNLNSIMCIIN